MDRLQEDLDPTFAPLSGIPPDQKSAWLFPSNHGEPTRRMEARFSDPAQVAVFQQLAQLRQSGNQSMADHWSAPDVPRTQVCSGPGVYQPLLYERPGAFSNSNVISACIDTVRHALAPCAPVD